MKKIFIYLMAFISIFYLTGCENKTSETIDEYENHKKLIALVTNFSILNTNGFDYSLEQKLDDVIVNTHTIQVRINSASDTIGERIEYKKTLNTDISNGQYAISNGTAYYKNNKIARNENDEWIWEDCAFDDFVGININQFTFDINSLDDIKLLIDEENATMTFKINNSKAKDILGIDGTIKDLTIEIVADKSYSKLLSFTMNYSQELTTTYFNFTTYSGNVNINIPE